jgi:2-iminobutanoate/2-iminopropanoate deaminase
MREIRSPAAPEPTGAYAQGLAAHGLLFLSGQAPYDAAGRLAGPGLEAQMRQAWENLDAVARAAGTSLARAVRIGAYLAPRADLAEYNRVYDELVNWTPRPARSTLRVDFKRFDVEFDAIVLLEAAGS